MRSIPDPVYRFADVLQRLLAARTATAVESQWNATALQHIGWKALEYARQQDDPHWESALDEADGFLLRLLDRLPLLAAASDADATHLRTFRLPELERLQHATAAALVVQRFGVAGLRTVLADEAAPLARRYFAFLALAERHPRREWPVFARYLTPIAHHAFVGTAAEAARFYSGTDASRRLVDLFRRVQRDIHLREFLGPRILLSLFTLADRSVLPLYRELLTAGHTHGDLLRCEVTHALVMVRRFTGAIEPSVKYADGESTEPLRTIERAVLVYQGASASLVPVAVI